MPPGSHVRAHIGSYAGGASDCPPPVWLRPRPLRRLRTSGRKTTRERRGPFCKKPSSVAVIFGGRLATAVHVPSRSCCDRPLNQYDKTSCGLVSTGNRFRNPFGLAIAISRLRSIELRSVKGPPEGSPARRLAGVSWCLDARLRATASGSHTCDARGGRPQRQDTTRRAPRTRHSRGAPGDTILGGHCLFSKRPVASGTR
jgi:hypothetical protein